MFVQLELILHGWQDVIHSYLPLKIKRINQWKHIQYMYMFTAPTHPPTHTHTHTLTHICINNQYFLSFRKLSKKLMLHSLYWISLSVCQTVVRITFLNAWKQDLKLLPLLNMTMRDRPERHQNRKKNWNKQTCTLQTAAEIIYPVCSTRAVCWFFFSIDPFFHRTELSENSCRRTWEKRKRKES